MDCPYSIGPAGDELTVWILNCFSREDRFLLLFKYLQTFMHDHEEPGQHGRTLYFTFGFIAVTTGFVVVLAGFLDGSDAILYMGAGIMGCAAALQSLLLFTRFRSD